MSKAIKFIKFVAKPVTAIWDIIKPAISRIDVPVELVRTDPGGIEMISIPILTWTEQVAETKALELKLDAAAEALREIECKTSGSFNHFWVGDYANVHAKAQDAYRATQA